MAREKFNWLIGLNLKLGRVEIHKHDPSNPDQVSHLIGVKKHYGVNVPKQLKKEKQDALDTLMDLNSL
jgi:hypothetical protein